VSATRLPAEERRAALLETACRLFSEGSYRGTTTADIAREAGVTEPVLYRHFASKRDLYLACLESVWEGAQAMWDEALAAEPDPQLWIATMGRSFIQSEAERPRISHLWVQAIAEGSEDEAIGAYMTEHMRAVHSYAADVIRRAQKAGGIEPERDADAEAWIFIALGLLTMADRVLGGVMRECWPEIRSSRLRWLTGSDRPDFVVQE
jgi:TetR/AcrR family transcriptional regulator